MGTEGFFRRWSRLKSHADDAPADAAASEDVPQAGREGQSHRADATSLGAGRSLQRAGTGTGNDATALHLQARAGAGTSVQHADLQQAIDLPPLAQTAPHPPVAPLPPERAPRNQPTLEDVAALGPDSDFSAFVSQGVDKNVQRLAMKKLFSDPHFSLLDGLDVYIDDYTKADPIPAAVLASLDHAKSMFARMLDNEAAKKGGDDAGAADGAAPGDPPPPDHNNDA